MPGRKAKYRAGTVNEQGAQIDIPAFTDAVQAGLPARGMLPRPNPSHAANWRPCWNALASPMVATRALAVIGPIPGHLLQLATLLIALVPVGNLLLQLGDVTVQFFDVRQQPSKESARTI